jgi:hypothetical protein
LAAVYNSTLRMVFAVVALSRAYAKPVLLHRMFYAEQVHFWSASRLDVSVTGWANMKSPSLVGKLPPTGAYHLRLAGLSESSQPRIQRMAVKAAFSWIRHFDEGSLEYEVEAVDSDGTLAVSISFHGGFADEPVDSELGTPLAGDGLLKLNPTERLPSFPGIEYEKAYARARASQRGMWRNTPSLSISPPFSFNGQFRRAPRYGLG